MTKGTELIERGFNLGRNFNISWEELPLLFRLAKIRKTHQKICEDYCNSYLSEERYDKRITQIENRGIKVLHELNKNEPDKFKLEFQHDPRGFTLRVSILWIKETGVYNDITQLISYSVY